VEYMDRPMRASADGRRSWPRMRSPGRSPVGSSSTHAWAGPPACAVPFEPPSQIEIMRERVCRRVRALYSPQRRQRDTQRVGDGAGHRPLDVRAGHPRSSRIRRHERIAVGPAHQPNRDSRGAAGANGTLPSSRVCTPNADDHVRGVGGYPLEREADVCAATRSPARATVRS
jgi:hypothetical protein